MSLSIMSMHLLNTSRYSDSTTVLGSLTSNLNLPQSNLRLFLLVLLLVTWEKRWTPTSLQSTIGSCRQQLMSPQLPFLQDQRPQLPLLQAQHPQIPQSLLTGLVF